MVLSTGLPNGALSGRHRVLLERGSTAVLGELDMRRTRRSPCRARRRARFGTDLALRSRRPTSRRARCLRLGFPVHAMRPRPLVPVGYGMLHRPQEVVHAAVSDELETLLQVGRELLIVRERFEVFLEATPAFEREELVGVVDDRRDLRPAADHTLVLYERVDIAVRHARHTLDVELMECLLDGWPLRVDDAPADACLEDALAQMLEIVVECFCGVLRRRPFHRANLPGPTATVAFSARAPSDDPARSADAVP